MGVLTASRTTACTNITKRLESLSNANKAAVKGISFDYITYDKNFHSMFLHSQTPNFGKPNDVD